MEEVIAANPQIQDPNTLQPGDPVKVPLDADDRQPLQYTVKSGETIRDIVQLHGSTPQDLARANGLAAPQDIKPGQQIWIPGAGPAADEATTDPAAPVTADTLGPLTPAQYTNNAAQQVLDAQSAINSMQKLGPAGRAELQDGYLQQNLSNAQTRLQQAVKAEFAARETAEKPIPMAPANDADDARWGQDIVGATPTIRRRSACSPPRSPTCAATRRPIASASTATI